MNGETKASTVRLQIHESFQICRINSSCFAAFSFTNNGHSSIRYISLITPEPFFVVACTHSLVDVALLAYAGIIISASCWNITDNTNSSGAPAKSGKNGRILLINSIQIVFRYSRSSVHTHRIECIPSSLWILFFLLGSCCRVHVKEVKYLCMCVFMFRGVVERA